MGAQRSAGSSSGSQRSRILAGAARAGLAAGRKPRARRESSDLTLECLEQRLLLSATHHTATPAAGAYLSGNIITVYGTNHADSITITTNASAGTLTAVINGASTTLPTAGVTEVAVNPLNGNDYVIGSGCSIAMYMTAGKKGNQTLIGGQGNDTMVGGAGNDVLRTGSGDDLVITGSGANRVLLGNGNDTVRGVKGKNIVSEGSGKDTLIGTKAHVSVSSRAVPYVSLNTPTVTAAQAAAPDDVFGTATGLDVAQIRNAYDFGDIADPNFTNRGDGQAIAVVIPYNTPLITQSLQTFSTTFGLPAPDANHFQVVYANGSVPPTDPNPNHPWETEAATDVEWAHAIAPDAKIYLVLASSDLFPDIFSAIDRAEDTLDANFGGGVVEVSLGSQGGELDSGDETAFDAAFTRPQARNISFVAASGDTGGVVSYPAISPYVTSVGGTVLTVDSNGNDTAPETAWTSGGGGTSDFYTAPAYQQGALGYAGSTTTVTETMRTNPDVAYNASPSSGVAVYDAQDFGDLTEDGTQDTGWLPGGAGGTSVAAAQWAGLVALANQQRIPTGRGYIGSGLNEDIYHVAETYGLEDFTDITTGSAGANAATTGYDLATGWGSPRATDLIMRLAQSDLETINSNGLTWNASYKLPIIETGALDGPGVGFFVGNGTASGGPAGVSLNFSPATNQPIDYTLLPEGTGSTSASTGSGSSSSDTTTNDTNIGPYASITQFTIGTLSRQDTTGKLYGTGTATLLVQVTTPVFNTPPIGGGGSAPTAGGGANTGGGGNSSGTQDGGSSNTTTSGYTGQNGSGTSSAYSGNNGNDTNSDYGSSAGVTPITNTTTTELIPLTLSFTGIQYKSASGQEHIRGAFVAIDPTTGRSATQGLETTFTGKFQDDA